MQTKVVEITETIDVLEQTLGLVVSQLFALKKDKDELQELIQAHMAKTENR